MGLEMIGLEFASPALPVLVTVALAIGWDLKQRRIPNGLTVPAAAAGILFHALAPAGQGIAFALAGLIIGGTLLLALFLMGGMGGGDVKLMAALGAWLGPTATLNLFVLTAAAGAIWAFMLIGYHRRLAPLGHFGRDVRAALQGNRRPAAFCSAHIPYALAFGLGVVGHLSGLRIIG